jgi:ABC-type sugar transport system permease subunit
MHAWLVILPGLVLVGLFSVYPLAFALYVSTRRLLLTRRVFEVSRSEPCRTFVF